MFQGDPKGQAAEQNVFSFYLSEQFITLIKKNISVFLE